MIPRHLAKDFIAGMQIADVPAYLLDPSGDVGPQNPVARLPKASDPDVGRTSGYCFAVGSIDGCRHDLDENFAIRRRGLGDLFDSNNGRRAILGADDCPHSPTRIQVPIHQCEVTLAGEREEVLVGAGTSRGGTAEARQFPARLPIEG
jgi:hypothetical protein